ncbi:MAG: FHA domain-containing protein [Pirellulaceae bacterium]|nr:FHA domain-containing protein [Pirellulaceae bacterium]
MKVKLKVVGGSHDGKEIAIGSEKFLIGRSESCQLRPKSESVSRKHCILVLRDNRLLIQDLKSRNGTYVNDKRLPADKAKVLKPGDQLRIGKLSFEVIIEHGLQAAKKPQVADVGDAAARTVEAGGDSKFEAVDVSSWLDEADQIDRVRKLSDPETRQFRLAEGQSAGDSSHDGDSTDLSVDDSTDADLKKKKRPPKTKQKPGKLPEGAKKSLKDSSRDAADDALKRFFSGR